MKVRKSKKGKRKMGRPKNKNKVKKINKDNRRLQIQDKGNV